MNVWTKEIENLKVKLNINKTITYDCKITTKGYQNNKESNSKQNRGDEEE